MKWTQIYFSSFSSHFFMIFFHWKIIKNRMKLKGGKTELSKTEFRLNNFITTSNFQHLLLMHLWNHYPRTSFLKRENTYISELYMIGHGIRKMYFEIAAFFEFCRRKTFKIRKFKWNKKFQIYTPQLLGVQHFFEFCRPWYSWFNWPKGGNL